MADLVCLGEVIVEMVADAVDQGGRQAGLWHGPYPSGAPAILADQAACCGTNVSVVGVVGDDDFGAVCRERLESSRVDTTFLATDQSLPTGVAFVRYRSDGSRTFIFHLANAAAGKWTSAASERALEGARCLHLMGSTAYSLEAATSMRRAADLALSHGAKVSFDPNIRPENLTSDGLKDQLRAILNRATYVLASRGELPFLTDGVTDEEVARGLLANGAQLVVIKDGARGCLVMGAGQELTQIPAMSAEEVDPTGAGDCFGGTFLACLLDGMAPERAARYACVAGALAVEARGPMEGNQNRTALEQAARSRRYHLSV